MPVIPTHRRGQERANVIVIPNEFANATIDREGDVGRRWIAQLPLLVDSLVARWGLTIEGTPMHGYLGIVVPVRRHNEACALKVSWIELSTAYEIAALTTWNGQGAVRLLKSDPEVGALLLERLDSRRSLRDLDVGPAVAIAGDVLRRLAVPPPSDVPIPGLTAEQFTSEFLDRWEGQNRPFSRSYVDASTRAARELGPLAQKVLVNYDLHYGNVLAGKREPWLSIDPKVVVGDPEFGIAQLLWTRLEDLVQTGGLPYQFDALVDRAGLDSQRARSWTLIRCVDYWMWALSVGLTEDPLCCQAIVDWLNA